jgi:mannose-6-phosphate isomerase-like protein (cupin superfamily)
MSDEVRQKVIGILAGQAVVEPEERFSLNDHVGPRTEEAGFVLSGRLQLEIEGVSQDLEAGDSFRFKGKAVRWRNTGDTEAVVIWVMSPPVY